MSRRALRSLLVVDCLGALIIAATLRALTGSWGAAGTLTSLCRLAAVVMGVYLWLSSDAK